MRLLKVALPFLLITGVINRSNAQQNAGPHILVYKTKHDYRNLVPVMLSDDRSSISSYPAPSDIKTGSGYPLPVLLHKGYLLDKRGIGKNVAFLRLTYKQYAQLKQVPSRNEMYKMIVDKDPLAMILDCGLKYRSNNSVSELNKLIDRGQLKNNCKSIN